jgi:hypothetical protein
VLTCHVGDCSYNCDAECCAPCIEVGESVPMCDTYTSASVSLSSGQPAVCECHIDRCTFNDASGCSAAGVTVSVADGIAECITYRL